MGNGESMYLDGRSMYLDGRSMYLDGRLVELVRFLLLLIRVMGTNLPLRYKHTLEKCVCNVLLLQKLTVSLLF